LEEDAGHLPQTFIPAWRELAVEPDDSTGQLVCGPSVVRGLQRQGGLAHAALPFGHRHAARADLRVDLLQQATPAHEARRRRWQVRRRGGWLPERTRTMAGCYQLKHWYATDPLQFVEAMRVDRDTGKLRITEQRSYRLREDDLAAGRQLAEPRREVDVL